MCPPSEPPAAESPTPNDGPKRPNPPPPRPNPPAAHPEELPRKESAKIISVSKPVRRDPLASAVVVAPVVTPVVEPVVEPAAAADLQTDEAEVDPAIALGLRMHPIPPPSDPMQYRAIGLVRGRYLPSEERLTKGMLLVENDIQIDSVLLGRVMSLVKNHIDLEKEHLWVVYPRTREDHLHLQVVGVWEPETLHRTPPEGSEEPVLEPAEVDEEFFSIRGEVMFQRVDQEAVTMRIQQAPRRPDDKAKAFKIHLKGVLGDRAVGYFWDVQVKREGDVLTIIQGTSIKRLPPKKPRKPPFDKKRGGGGGARRFNRGERPGGDRPPGDRPPTPRPQRNPEDRIPKPRPRTAAPDGEQET